MTVPMQCIVLNADLPAFCHSPEDFHNLFPGLGKKQVHLLYTHGAFAKGLTNLFRDSLERFTWFFAAFICQAHIANTAITRGSLSEIGQQLLTPAGRVGSCILQHSFHPACISIFALQETGRVQGYVPGFQARDMQKDLGGFLTGYIRYDSQAG